MYPAPKYLEWAQRFYGQVPYDLASSGMAAVSRADLGDPPDLGDPRGRGRLLAAIARYNAVREDEVAPALGATHAIWLAYASVLSPGDEVLVEAPAYEPLRLAAESLGARVLRFERPPAEGFRVDPGRVASAMTDRTRVVALTNLHNPSGVATSDEVLGELARVVGARGAFLLVDEVYAPFDSLVRDDGIWTGTARKLAPNVVVVSSLTKCFGLGEHRLGWVIAPREVASAARSALLSTVGHFPLSHANLGAHAFGRLPALAARARALLGSKRRTVGAWIAKRPDLRWSNPDRGLFGFAWKSSGDVDWTSRIERSAAEHGVIVGPGAFFDEPEGFRLSWSIDEGKLDEGLNRLARLLGPLPA